MSLMLHTEEAECLLEINIEKYKEKASKLAAWMQDNIPDGFSIFQLPKDHRKKLRTTNMAENINKQMKLLGASPRGIFSKLSNKIASPQGAGN